MLYPMNAPFKPRIWKFAHNKSLELGSVGHLMGVINVTPDSFSDGGLFSSPDSATKQAERLSLEGASILDIGAESTKPGAKQISAEDEQERLLPALNKIAGLIPSILLSVDTYRAQTADLAVGKGAHIINDVWGVQREPDIARVAADTGAGLIIMHTNRDRVVLDDVIEDQKAYFEKSLDIALQLGVQNDQIVLDPGFGFGKETTELNLLLMKRFNELLDFPFPFLVGTSRKRFLGAVTDKPAAQRDAATAATTVILRQKGVSLFRVHDVAINADALRVCDAMLALQEAK